MNPMKKIMVQYAGYNCWANQRIIDCILQLNEEEVNRNMESSYKSIYATLLHMWDAESAWWQRVKLKDQVEWPGTTFTGSAAMLATSLMQQSRQWEEWAGMSTQAAFEHEYIYRNSKKEQFKQPVYETLLHLFNHQSYHRGQIVSMLRQLGVTKIPATDMIVYFRKPH